MKARLNNLQRTLDGKLTATFEVDCEPEELQDLFDKDLTLQVKKLTRKRSLDANALLWATLGEMAKALNADKWDLYLQMLKGYGRYTYISIDKEALEDFKGMYRECEVVGETEDKVCLICYVGSSLYTKEEFSKLLDGVFQECREAGIHLKASTEIEERYKQWQKKA